MHGLEPCLPRNHSLQLISFCPQQVWVSEAAANRWRQSRRVDEWQVLARCSSVSVASGTSAAISTCLERCMTYCSTISVRQTGAACSPIQSANKPVFQKSAIETGCAHVCEVSGGCLLCGDRFDCGLQIQSRGGQQGQSCGVGSIPAGSCLLSCSLSGGFQSYMARTKVSMLTSQGVVPRPPTYYSCFPFHWSPS